jgi:hypothetical protein
MTTIDHANYGSVALGDRWRLFVAMVVYAAGVSFYETRSMMVDIGELSATQKLGPSFELMMAGTTFVSIVACAIGFMLLAALLDIWTGRRPQPLAALNLALPAVATFELIKIPLFVMAFQVWFWATRV